MAKVGLYKGFSSVSFDVKKTFKIYDIECVKADLLNHIFTRKGERVMMPDFGTGIPDLTFEPIDEITISSLREELTYVFDYDPRVELLNLVINTNIDENSIDATATLRYVELDLVDNLNINIEFREIL